MSNHITLTYDQPVCDVKQFGTFYVALDEQLRLHRITPSIKKEKSFNVVKTESPGLQKKILSDNALGYIKNNTLCSLSLKDKKRTSYRWSGEGMACFAESVDGKFLAAGYEKGKVNLFSTELKDIYASLNFECGDVLKLVFDTKTDLLLVLGERHRITVYDPILNRTVCTLSTDTRVLHGVFINDLKLFCVHENGLTSIIDIRNQAVISSHNNNISNPTALATNPKRDYAIVGEKNGKVTVILIERNKVLFTHDVTKLPILSIQWVERTLFFLFYDGTVTVYPLTNDFKLVEDSLKNESYHAASHAIKKNAFLSLFSSIENHLDTVWNETIFPQALDALLDGDEARAKDLAEPFIHDVYKHKVFHLYTDGSEVTKEFLKAYEESDYSTIFSLADQYPHLKKSTKYRVVNDEWELAFAKAFEVMKNGHKVKAGQILHPFNEVESKKNIISLLINFPQIFIEADFFFKNRRIKEYFAHAAKNKIWKNPRHYRKLADEAEKIKKAMETAEKKRDLKATIAYAKRLALYLPYKPLAKKTIDTIRNRVLFLDHLKKNNTAAAYAQVKEDYSIIDLSEFEPFHEPFRRAELDAYRAAYEGKTMEVLTILEKYLGMEALKDSIAPIMKLAYLEEFRQIEDKEAVDWRATLEYYSLYFGIDQDIRDTLKELGKEEMLYKMVGGRDRTGYRKYDFVPSLIKEKTEDQIKAEKEKKKNHSHVTNYIIIAVGVGLFALTVAIVITLLQPQIESYKNERRQGPYKLFEKVYEHQGRQ